MTLRPRNPPPPSPPEPPPAPPPEPPEPPPERSPRPRRPEPDSPPPRLEIGPGERRGTGWRGVLIWVDSIFTTTNRNSGASGVHRGCIGAFSFCGSVCGGSEASAAAGRSEDAMNRSRRNGASDDPAISGGSVRFPVVGPTGSNTANGIFLQGQSSRPSEACTPSLVASSSSPAARRAIDREIARYCSSVSDPSRRSRSSASGSKPPEFDSVPPATRRLIHSAASHNTTSTPASTPSHGRVSAARRPPASEAVASCGIDGPAEITTSIASLPLRRSTSRAEHRRPRPCR